MRRRGTCCIRSISRRLGDRIRDRRQEMRRRGTLQIRRINRRLGDRRDIDKRYEKRGKRKDVKRTGLW